MGILSSTTSITRYRVEGKLAEPFLTHLRKGLNTHAITDIDGELEDKSIGWTNFEKPFAPEFDDASFMLGTHLIFSLRIDKKSIPPKVLKKHYLRELDRRLAEAPNHYFSREEKKEIKDHISRKLILRIPATPSIYDLIWNSEEASLWFFSTQKAANEALETLFKHSFHLPLIRIFPYTLADLLSGLSDSQRDSLNMISPTSFTR